MTGLPRLSLNIFIEQNALQFSLPLTLTCFLCSGISDLLETSQKYDQNHWWFIIREKHSQTHGVLEISYVAVTHEEISHRYTKTKLLSLNTRCDQTHGLCNIRSAGSPVSNLCGLEGVSE